ELSSRRPARSCPRTSGRQSRTSASAISTRSSREPSCGRSSAACSRSSSQMATEAEGTQGAVEQLRLRERLAKLRDLPLLRGVGVSGEMARLQRQIERIATAPTADEVWQAVELARHPNRPYTLDYVERMFDDFVELRGDRSLGDDAAGVSGLCR